MASIGPCTVRCLLLTMVVHLGNAFPVNNVINDNGIDLSKWDRGDDMIRKGNAIVDDFLLRIQYKLDEKFEPISLPEKSFGFGKKILLVTVKGEIKMFDGWLAGFSTLHRNGDAKLFEYDGSRILVVPLGVSNLLGHYKGHAKFMNFGPSIDVNIKVSSLSAEMYLTQYDSMAQAEVSSLTFKHVRDTDVDIDGLGPLDWVLSPFYDFVLSTFKSFISGWLERPVKTWLDEQLQIDGISLRDD